jgi:hypothetical protein
MKSRANWGDVFVPLIAFLLGAIFAWLAESGWELSDDEIKAAIRVIGYIFIVPVFVAAAIVFFIGLYGRLAGYREWWPVQAVDLATFPDIAGTILGIAAGAFVVWQRARLKRLCQRLLLAIIPPPGAADPGATNGREGASPWVVGAAALSAISLVAILVAVIFFPEITGRVSSIKIAGVEAQFATSTAHSARVAIQGDKSRSSNRYILNQWTGIDQTLNRFTVPALAKVIAKSDSDVRLELRPIRDFLDAFAVPLSSVMSCFSGDFNPRSTFVQAEAAPVANEWERMTIEVLGKEHLTEEFSALKSHHEKVVRLVDDSLWANHSHCGPLSTDDTYPAKSHRWNQAYFATDAYRSQVKDVAEHLPQVLSNGYTIAFIANLLMLTASPDEAVRFMNAVGGRLDHNNNAIAGEYNFYSARARAKWQLDDWMLDDWIPDLKSARLLAEQIADTVKKSDPSASAEPLGIESHYRMLAADDMNSLIYGYVRDWLQGRHSAPLELVEPTSWAKQLSDWLDAQSLGALLTNSKDDPEAFGRLIYMVNSYDTLGMYELLASQSETEPSKTHCERGLAFLNASRNLLEKLYVFEQGYGDSYRAELALHEAHINIYQSVCPLLTVQ